MCLTNFRRSSLTFVGMNVAATHSLPMTTTSPLDSPIIYLVSDMLLLVFLLGKKKRVRLVPLFSATTSNANK